MSSFDDRLKEAMHCEKFRERVLTLMRRHKPEFEFVCEQFSDPSEAAEKQTSLANKGYDVEDIEKVGDDEALTKWVVRAERQWCSRCETSTPNTESGEA